MKGRDYELLCQICEGFSAFVFCNSHQAWGLSPAELHANTNVLWICVGLYHVFLIHYFYKEQFHWKYLLFKGLEAQPEYPKESDIDVPSICSVLSLASMSSELCFCCGKTSGCSSSKVCGRILLFANERERYQCAISAWACFQLQFKMEKSYLHTLSKRCDDVSLVLTICIRGAFMAVQWRCRRHCYRYAHVSAVNQPRRATQVCS